MRYLAATHLYDLRVRSCFLTRSNPPAIQDRFIFLDTCKTFLYGKRKQVHHHQQIHHKQSKINCRKYLKQSSPTQKEVLKVLKKVSRKRGIGHEQTVQRKRITSVPSSSGKELRLITERALPIRRWDKYTVVGEMEETHSFMEVGEQNRITLMRYQTEAIMTTDTSIFQASTSTAGAVSQRHSCISRK